MQIVFTPAEQQLEDTPPTPRGSHVAAMLQRCVSIAFITAKNLSVGNPNHALVTAK